MTEPRHNYDAVNAAVMHEQRKALEEVRVRRATTMELYSHTGLRWLIGGAIFAISLGLTWWLVKEHERPGDTIIHNNTTRIRTLAQEGIEALAEATPSTKSEVTTRFTVFNTIGSSEKSVGELWLGKLAKCVI